MFDVKIFTNDGFVEAHKSELAHNSDFFKKIFSGIYKDEDIKFNISKKIMNSIISFMYSNIIDDANICDLL